MHITRLIGHALSAAVRRDGTADNLQQSALEEGRALASDLARAAPVARGHTPDAMLLDTLSAKILGAWLQNRHQTLYPLAMNLRNMPEAHSTLIFAAVAGALRMAGVAPEDHAPRLERWLAGVGASDSHRTALAAAHAAPPALYETVEHLLDAHLGPFAFAACLAALDQRVTTNRLFLEFLAARLGLPSDMSRSLAQRYRL